MKFNTHQQEIIKKIASGEITDIVSYIKAFQLFELKKLFGNMAIFEIRRIGAGGE